MATKIRGRGLSGLLKYTKLKVGEEGLKKALDKLSEEDKTIFSDKIRPEGWYSFETYVKLLAIVDRELGSGDLSVCKDIGRWSAERDFKARYELFAGGDDFKSAISYRTVPQAMWKGYHDQGVLMVPEIPTSLDIDEIKFRVLDFPDAAKHNCRLIEGWLEMAAESIVELEGAVTEVKCRVDGDEYCEFLWVKGIRGK